MQVNMKVIKPAGAVFILILSAAATVMLFTVKLDVPSRHEPKHGTEFYARNPHELLAELEGLALPHYGIDAALEITADGARVLVMMDRGNYDRGKALILRDFDESLLEFERVT
jgi:hypothetical protein